jgi:hypothetical protein
MCFIPSLHFIDWLDANYSDIRCCRMLVVYRDLLNTMLDLWEATNHAWETTNRWDAYLHVETMRSAAIYQDRMVMKQPKNWLASANAICVRACHAASITVDGYKRLTLDRQSTNKHVSETIPFLRYREREREREIYWCIRINRQVRTTNMSI